MTAAPDLSLECSDVIDFLASRKGFGARALITDMPYSSGGATRGDRVASPLAKYGVDDAWDDSENFEGDSRGERAFTYWCTHWMRQALRAVAPGGVIACFIDWRQIDNVNLAMEAAGWVRRGILAWDKGAGTRPQRGRPRQQLEFVAWGSRGPFRDLGLPPFPGCFPYSLKPNDKHHPVGKPVDVMRWLVGGFCPAGTVALDPFMGAGSTGLACAQLGVGFQGGDISEKWVRKARRRLEGRPGVPVNPLRLLPG